MLTDRNLNDAFGPKTVSAIRCNGVSQGSRVGGDSFEDEERGDRPSDVGNDKMKE